MSLDDDAQKFEEQLRFAKNCLRRYRDEKGISLDNTKEILREAYEILPRYLQKEYEQKFKECVQKINETICDK